MSAEVDARLANRILIGLVHGAAVVSSSCTLDLQLLDLRSPLALGRVGILYVSPGSAGPTIDGSLASV